MKEQRLITHDDRYDWTKNVNDYLERGWTVVPGTLQIAISATTTVNGSVNYSSAEKHTIFSVVVEREISKAE